MPLLFAYGINRFSLDGAHMFCQLIDHNAFIVTEKLRLILLVVKICLNYI